MTETPGDSHDQSEYVDEVAARYDPEAVARSQAQWTRLGADGQARHQDEHKEIARAIAGLAARHLEPEHPEVQKAVARHHAWVSVFWVPGREQYKGLADSYTLDHRFESQYDKFGDGTARLLRDGIHVWAENELE